MPVAEFALPEPMHAALVEAYATPPRAYHHFGHVAEVMRHYQWVAGGDGWHAPREVELAVLYHDAVYVPGRSDNEARSAQLARESIGRWLGGQDVDDARVAELILMTARHGQWSPQDFPEDANGRDARRFLDCDMAIVGADRARFDAYDAAIAEEYRGVVPRWLYRRKRRAFFAGLLRRERIYLSPGFHERFEARARANLKRVVETGVAG